jgi:hypothetical protein
LVYLDNIFSHGSSATVTPQSATTAQQDVLKARSWKSEMWAGRAVLLQGEVLCAKQSQLNGLFE